MMLICTVYLLPYLTNLEHQKVFRKVPIIGFQRAKSLKDVLVRAKISQLRKMNGFVDHVKNRDVKFVSSFKY